MAFTVVYDACVLYPALLRDVLLRIAEAGIVRARCTREILDECIRAIAENRPDLAPEKLERTGRAMAGAVPDFLVTDYEPLVPGLMLPDANDRHVLAAAIRCSAQAIVTFNLEDFPVEAVSPFGIEAKHPDDFLLESLDLAPTKFGAILEALHQDWQNPPLSVKEILDALEGRGIVRTVARLRAG